MSGKRVLLAIVLLVPMAIALFVSNANTYDLGPGKHRTGKINCLTNTVTLYNLNESSKKELYEAIDSAYFMKAGCPNSKRKR